jgi:hypothetical protein
MVKGTKRTLALVLLGVLATFFFRAEVRADDLQSVSARLAEQSFRVLHRLTGSSDAESSQLIGSLASLADDAESLRQALVLNDRRAAQAAMASLVSDRQTIDQALSHNPGTLKLEEWANLRAQLDKLVREMAACRTASDAICEKATSSESKGKSRTESLTDAGGPHIVIVSRESDGAGVRLKGYFEGIDLKSAGIYEGSKELRAFKVDGLAGRQRVEFDLRLEDPSAFSLLRVVDAAGKSAQAFVAENTSELAAASSDAAIPSGPATAASASDSDLGRPIAGLNDTAEIPSYGPLLPSPSKRHTLASRLGDARIDVLSLTRIATLPPTYEIVGRIHGRGITRAGIYLDGRLVETIPIVPGANDTTFDRQFRAEARRATIRAYSVGNQFIEEPLVLDEARDSAQPLPYADGVPLAAPLQSSAPIRIQVTSIRPLTGGTYLVNGVISGANLAAAGLYQNGVLVQNIDLNVGVAGAPSAFSAIPRSINFSVRFNPSAGPATIRAFDRTGAFSEQPLVVASLTPYLSVPPNSLPAGIGNPLYGRGIPNARYPVGIGSGSALW